MSGRISRRTTWMWVLLALIVLGVLLPPYVNVNRFRSRVTASIGRALGREVTVSNIALQLLPRPGLVLANFVVSDGPGYGSEPMLQAGTVTALLRMSSLWRGRLEIGTLELDDPSLNLVRRSDGRWNLEELVQRTAKVPSAPTSKVSPETRPRFPYVKASSGRINFKLGDVKKAFAVTDADFGLWQESENDWGLRLEGRPVRTDVNLSDSGTVSLEGRFQRAATTQDTPLSIRVIYRRAQLGAVSKLAFGRDRGWRGSVSGDASLSGTPSALSITLDGEVNDFRRYDIALGEALRLRIHCVGTYSSPVDAVQDLQCESPVGDGVIRIRGNERGWPGGSYAFGVTADQLPMERVVAFARHAKRDLPSDLTATGTVDAVFTVQASPGGAATWSGGGTAKDVVLHSGVLKKDLELGELQFAIPTNEMRAVRQVVRRKGKGATNDGLRLVVKPLAIPLGASPPAIAAAVFDTERYQVSLTGNAELSQLLSVARSVGVGTPGIGLEGNADINLKLSGTWAGFAPPAPSGKVDVHNITAELQGVAEPLQVTSAAAAISDQALNINSFTAAFADGPAFNGSASFPVHCTAPETCVVHFDVHTGDVTLARMNQLLNPSFVSRPWYRLLAVWQRHEDALLKLQARGRFYATRLAMASLVASNVSGDLTLDAGKIRLNIVGSELLGGNHSGVWNADFTQSPPRFVGGGTVSRISMEQLSVLMHDSWAAGVASGKYAVSLQGSNAATLRNSADGSATFTWNSGSLRHVALEGHSGPITFSAFTGTMSLENGKFTLSDGEMQAGNTSFAVKGTASYDRNVDFRFEHPGGQSYTISGSLDKPRVEPVTPSTEAQLR